MAKPQPLPEECPVAMIKDYPRFSVKHVDLNDQLVILEGFDHPYFYARLVNPPSQAEKDDPELLLLPTEVHPLNEMAKMILEIKPYVY